VRRLDTLYLRSSHLTYGMRCDILIVGAGILGLSSAYHLKAENPRKRVVVIERLRGPGEGNTAKSEAVFRDAFTSETNRVLASSSIEFFRHLEGEGYNLRLAFTGYLWLLSEEQFEGVGDAIRDMQRDGVKLTIYQREELERLIPGLATSFEGDEEAELMGLPPIDVGLLAHNCGCLRAEALAKAYESMFLKLGGEIHYRVEAKRLILGAVEELGLPGEPHVWQEPQVKGVETDRGVIEAETTVVAAGVWAGRLLEPIGFDPCMRPKKRQIFVLSDERLSVLFDIDGFNRHRVLPFTILPKCSLYLKAEPYERSVWVGCSDEIGRAFELEDDPQPELEYYKDDIYPILMKYLPCFKDLRPVNMWAGQYAVNSFDGHPIVESIPGLIYVGAASGSGIMKSDALGRIVAALYAGREWAELFDGSRFRVSDLSIYRRRTERERFVI